jgi:hypothetical protein
MPISSEGATTTYFNILGLTHVLWESNFAFTPAGVGPPYHVADALLIKRQMNRQKDKHMNLCVYCHLVYELQLTETGNGYTQLNLLNQNYI